MITKRSIKPLLPAPSSDSSRWHTHTEVVSVEGMCSVLLVVAFLAAGVTASALAQTAASGTNRDLNGWTIFTPSVDSRVVYVSSSTGKDTQTGLSQDMPFKTIAKGISRLRSGHPDWLLLKKGDTWYESVDWSNSGGRSASQPMLISSYGTGPRPLIETGSHRGFSNTQVGGSRGNGTTNNLAIVGLHFYANTRDPNSSDYAGNSGEAGFSWIANGTNILIEDNVFRYYTVNIVLGASGLALKNFSLRRNIIADAYSTTGHSEGIFSDGVTGLIMEENLFDHNGWNASIEGAEANVFNRNIYLAATTTQVFFKGNISANSASEGAQFRSGGTIINNLFVRNSSGFDLGHLQGDPIITFAEVHQNVILESNDIQDAPAPGPRGFGIVFYSAKGTGVKVTNNIIAHVASAFPYGAGLNFDSTATAVDASNNIIYDWTNPIVTDPGNPGANIISPNQINLTGYPDPNRTVGTYNASLGGSPTLMSFLAQARKQSKDNWRPQYTAEAVINYIGAGFGIY
jgi:hypothetical protein